MAKGAPNPVTKRMTVSTIHPSRTTSHLRQSGPPTHESPVSEEEVLGHRVEGDVGARTLGVVVGAAELGTGGRKATAGNEGGGHTGPESGGGVHLEELGVRNKTERQTVDWQQQRTLVRGRSTRMGGSVGYQTIDGTSGIRPAGRRPRFRSLHVTSTRTASFSGGE